MTPAEMVESHPVVARGYYAGARENLVSPGVTPEQTVGDKLCVESRICHSRYVDNIHRARVNIG